MRVFLLQKSNKYDVSAAGAYGELIYLIDDYLPPFDPDKTIARIRARLEEFNFDYKQDAIVLTGASILISIFLSVLIWDCGEVKTLLFDARTGKYKLVNINLIDDPEFESLRG